MKIIIISDGTSEDFLMEIMLKKNYRKEKTVQFKNR